MKLRKIVAIMIVASLLMAIAPALASVSEPHNADAMWVEPSINNYSTANASIGSTFTVYVCLNISATQTAFSYQIGLHYNRTQLKCTGAGYTNGTKSLFMDGLTTSGLIQIDTSFLGNGSILASEASLSTAEPGPRAESLIWAEFQILIVPTFGNLTSKLNISGQYQPDGAGDTWVDTTGSFVYLDPLNCVDGLYLFIGPSGPPTPGPLSVSISPPAATIHVGQSVPFGSTVSGGIPPYTYQWFLNGGPAPNGTSNSWTFTPATNGSYTVNLNVTDNIGTTASSNVASVTVMPPPGGTRIYVDPVEIRDLTMGPSSTFYINITVANATDLKTCVFNLTCNSSILKWIGIDVFEIQNQYPVVSLIIGGDAGFMWVSLNYSTAIDAIAPTPIVRLHFHVEAYGGTVLGLQDTQLLDSGEHPITHQEFDGLFINEIRDVAVTNVVPSTNLIYQGWTDNINVTVKNLGNESETFNASAYYNSTLIQTVPIVNLAPGTETTVIIPWDTTGVPEGNYTVEGVASTVPFETNTTNNIYVDGTVQVTTVIHDVAITDVTSARSWVYQGNPVNITVTAKNLGNLSESFNVSAYADSNLIGTTPVTGLASDTEVALTFQWNTTGVTSCHNYTIRGEASIVPHEFNTTNNNFTDGSIKVRIRGDINGDGKVDGKDLTILALAFGSYGPDFIYPGSLPSSNWNPDADINLDNKVDGKDLMAIAKNFGTSCIP
jgi:hypothetical protein